MTERPYMRCVDVQEIEPFTSARWSRRVVVTNNRNSVVISFYINPYYDDELEDILADMFGDD